MSNTIEIQTVGNKYHVIMNGNVVHKAGTMAAAQITVEKRKRENPGLVLIQGDVHVNLATGQEVDYVEEFTIAQRFRFLEKAVTQIAKGTSHALIVVGQGGLGKTHTILTKLADLGYNSYDDAVAAKAEEIRNAQTEEDLAAMDLSTVDVPKLGTFKMVKGHSSAKALYRTMWENHDGLIVFDDCDSIQRDMTSLNLLKAGLDTQGKRIISWLSEGFIDDGLPKSFEFTGRIIFISNRPMNTWDSAVTSRANTINVTMTKTQIIERMTQIVNEVPTFEPNHSLETKMKVIELMDREKDRITNLNLRNLIKGINAYAEDQDEEYVTYLMTNFK